MDKIAKIGLIFLEKSVFLDVDIDAKIILFAFLRRKTLWHIILFHASINPRFHSRWIQMYDCITVWTNRNLNGDWAIDCCTTIADLIFTRIVPCISVVYRLSCFRYACLYKWVWMFVNIPTIQEKSSHHENSLGKLNYTTQKIILISRLRCVNQGLHCFFFFWASWENHRNDEFRGRRERKTVADFYCLKTPPAPTIAIGARSTVSRLNGSRALADGWPDIVPFPCCWLQLSLV